MQNVHFETFVENGYIKIPEQYATLNNKRVLVNISDGNLQEEKGNKTEKMKSFLNKYRGLLKKTGLPENIDIKEIREMRLNLT